MAAGVKNDAGSVDGSVDGSVAGSVDGSVNEVHLVGRLSGQPTVRVLPSGDQLTSWRLVVDRGNNGAAAVGHRSPTIDTIDCVAHKRSIQGLAARWVPGDLIRVRGALRRRFWRSGQGAASRYEVEVIDAKKVGSAAATAGRPRTGTRA